MTVFSREVAKRVFAGELRRSNLAFREGDDQQQYAPQYLLTPTGARCNRVFLVGTLTERDDIGSDTEYWRGRVVDPTGSVLVYAGQYQPEAAQVLSGLEPPAFVAVVGKPSLYETEDGKVIVSVRAEAVHKVDQVTRDRWVLETARKTLERVRCMEGLDAPTGDFITANAASRPKGPEDDDLQRARMHYGTDTEEYRQMAQIALSALKDETEGLLLLEGEAQGKIGGSRETLKEAGGRRPAKMSRLPTPEETEAEDEVEEYDFAKYGKD